VLAKSNITLKFVSMAEVYVNTTQNVRIKYAAAGVGYRILSNILDYVFLFAYVWFILSIMGVFSGLNDFNIWIIIVLVAPAGLYHLWTEVLLNGQTFGMKLLKTKVIRLDGTPPDIVSYFIRWIFRIIDVSFWGIPCIICIAVSKQGQRWGDMAAGTTVVRLVQGTALKDTILNVGQGTRELIFKEVNVLSDKDVGITKDVYQLCQRNNNYTALAQLASKLKERMNVTSEMDDKTFVETVLADYNTYQFD
jgi:uncharacterized RDD family membrane protein YckC